MNRKFIPRVHIMSHLIIWGPITLSGLIKLYFTGHVFFRDIQYYIPRSYMFRRNMSEKKKKSLVNNFPTHKISVIAWNLVLFIKFFAVIVKFILKFQGFKLQNIIVKKIILSPWVMDEFHYYFNSIQGYQSCVYVVYYINVFLELGFDSKLINNKNFVILSTIKCVLSENQP